MTPSQTAAALQPSETSVTPTVYSSPTSTLIPTATSLPQVHALEVPINVDSRKFLIHRVLKGETFEMLDATYKAIPEVIRSLNYFMKPSLWANSQIVISPGLQTVGPALPAFQTFEHTKPTTIDQLAVKLNIDPVLLRRYTLHGHKLRFSAAQFAGLKPLLSTWKSSRTGATSRF